MNPATNLATISPGARAAVIEQLKTLRETLLQAHPSLQEDERALLDYLEGETDVADILRQLAQFIIATKTLREGLETRIRTMRERRQRFENTEIRSRAVLAECMDAVGLKQLLDPEFTASVRQGLPETIVTDPTALPEEFVRVRREPALEPLGDALRRGDNVPGATLGNARPVLTIRRA